MTDFYSHDELPNSHDREKVKKMEIRFGFPETLLRKKALISALYPMSKKVQHSGDFEHDLLWKRKNMPD